MQTQSNENGERTLYGFWLSPFVSIAAHLLTEAGLPYRYQRISPFLGENVAAEYLSRNAFGKVPCLEEPDGAVISESQTIGRYLSRRYESAASIYPCADPVACAEVDRINDFLTFSVSGPFINWILVSAYWPKVLGAKTESESEIFNSWSLLLTKMNLGRLTQSASLSPYLLGAAPTLPDFHLFHILEAGITTAKLFDMPQLDLVKGDPLLEPFYQAMLARPSTAEILAAKAAEQPLNERELFEDFARTQAPLIAPANQMLAAMFGHPV